MASTLALIALVFAAAFLLDRRVPAPVWSLLNGLFWLALLVSAIGAILRSRHPPRAQTPHQRSTAGETP